MPTQARSKVEFGDFQTPEPLAREVAVLVRSLVGPVGTVVEPTAGLGTFLVAAAEAFPGARLEGFEINPSYCAEAHARLAAQGGRVRIHRADFFETDWPTVLGGLPGPVLVLGNPPWVTSAALGALGAGNAPRKSNFQHHHGLDARTGRSNFDISEWMLIQLLHALEGTGGALAVLVKSSVARKLFLRAATERLRLADFRCHRIDAARHFGAATDAVLLFCRGSDVPGATECRMYARLEAAAPESTIALRAGRLVADAELFDRHARFHTAEPYPWRSGLKHDLAKVMELVGKPGALANGFGETVDLEDTCLFPLMKSSDLGGTARKDRWVLVPQRRIGEPTARLATEAPRTWAYLLRHTALFAARKSSIHRRADPFSIFGVGDYSFSPWKVGISSLHRNLHFRAIGPWSGKPVMLDDASYFLPCGSREAAGMLLAVLASEPGQGLLRSLIFDDSKRIVTKEVLGAVDLEALAGALGIEPRVRWRTGRGSIDTLE